MDKRFHPFLFVVVALFILLLSPTLFSDGMFMDGLMYASVARNLAEGDGSFWMLHFSDTHLSAFHEHPPLVMGLQSVFFRLFGDSILVEKLYSMATYFLSGGILFLIWQQVTLRKFSEVAWLPFLFWLVMPLVYWGAANNMLENTMLIFVCLSVLFLLKASSTNSYLYMLLSGAMLFCAFLSKGFTGLFPLALPFCLWCFQLSTFKEFMIRTVFISAGLLLPALLLFCFVPAGVDSIQAYLNAQVFKSIQNIQTVPYRAYIVVKLMTELGISVGLTTLFVLLGRRHKANPELKSWSGIFFSLGLCAVLPIMVSMKQNGFYILCALPFFAIALALLVAVPMQQWLQRIKIESRAFRIFKTMALLLLFTSGMLAYAQRGKINRNSTLVHDIKVMTSVLPAHTVISVPAKYRDHWAMYGYFQRYGKVSMQPNDDFRCGYLLLDKREICPSSYALFVLPTQEFNLYRRRTDLK